LPKGFIWLPHFTLMVEMGNPRGLGFGGFLVGLGVGWLLFTYLDISSQMVAWLLIIAGGAIVASALLSYLSPGFSFGGLISPIAAGLVIALVATSGFGALWPGSWMGGYKYSVDESRNLHGGAWATSLLFNVENVNGNVGVSTWDKAEYNIDLSVKAYGNTESEASENLKKVEASIDERTLQGRLELILTISVPRLTWNRVNVNIVVTLPADATISLDVETTNGGVSVKDLTGGTLVLKTTNGAIVFDGVDATTIQASTTNGAIEGSVQATDLTAGTTNGRISVSLPCTRSGSYGLRTTNGNVDVTVEKTVEVGFDLDMSTSVGSVNLSISGLTYETNTTRHKIARTEGYDNKPVRISIEASTTNGSGSIHT